VKTAQLHDLAQSWPPSRALLCFVNRLPVAGRFITPELSDLIVEANAALGALRSCLSNVGARMAFACCVMAAGALLLIVGLIGIGLHRNGLHSTAQI